MSLNFPRLFALLVWLLPPGVLALGAVIRVEVTSRTPYAEGRSFEGVGPYEVRRGKVTFAVDPTADANRAIIDLELAPRNAAGLVEFSADVEFLAPVDPARASGAMIYDVCNRGKKMALRQFNPEADEFLMRRGTIVAWSGWTAETSPGSGRLRMTAPVATDDGETITGRVRAEVVVNAPVERWTLAQWANQGVYEPTKRGEAEAVLTWRLREADPRVEIPRAQWRLERRRPANGAEPGQLPEFDLVVSGGLRPGYIYEVVYEAKNPIVQGLGLAGIRDLVSFLKYDRTGSNPLRLATGEPAVQYAYGFGVSQSGRCLRMFLYDGFNADEQGRRVFDGVVPHVAGAGLGFFNHRFASPTRPAAQHENHLYPTDVFPFTYGDSRDPFTGRVDGVLRRARMTHTVPKVMHTHTSSEYWGRAGSLVHTDPLGQVDVELPPEIRVYCYGGAQHGAGSGIPADKPGNGQQISNPANTRPFNRALLTALDAWVRHGKPPPPSVYPRISDGTLVGWRAHESGWRPLPNVRYPEVIHQPEVLDRGSDFFRLRRTAIEPPVSRGHYVVKTPVYGDDNNERGTLELPSLAVPVATFTSWNLRSPEVGAETELLKLNGSYIPFSRTAQDRKRTGDPRPALLERYRNYEDYRAQFLATVRSMIDQRYLLPEEVDYLMNSIERHRALFE